MGTFADLCSCIKNVSSILMKGGVEILICHTYSSLPDDVRKWNIFGSQTSYILCSDLKIRVSPMLFTSNSIFVQKKKQLVCFPSLKLNLNRKYHTTSQNVENGFVSDRDGWDSRVSLMMLKKRLRWVKTSKTHVNVIHWHPASESPVQNLQRESYFKKLTCQKNAKNDLKFSTVSVVPISVTFVGAWKVDFMKPPQDVIIRKKVQSWKSFVHQL